MRIMNFGAVALIGETALIIFERVDVMHVPMKGTVGFERNMYVDFAYYSK